MPGERLGRILDLLESKGKKSHGSSHLCEVAAEIVGVSGAGIMLMSGDIPQGSLCTTNQVSNLIEELQYTLGEGPCVDAYRNDIVVLEPDLAHPVVSRWLAFSPRALEAGVKAIFGFPLREGTARLGALNLYQEEPGPLSDDQHADALVMSDLIARWVFDELAGAEPGALPSTFEVGADFHGIVHNAAGMVSVQFGVSVAEALILLRARAFAENRLVRDVAEDVVTRRLRLGEEPA